MPKGTIISGTNVYLPISNLYASVRIANNRLTRDQLLVFLERLSNKEKHCDVLFEMRPINDLKQNLYANYEVAGFGIGNTTCDWQIKGCLLT
jgi:hypothetical protein